MVKDKLKRIFKGGKGSKKERLNRLIERNRELINRVNNLEKEVGTLKSKNKVLESENERLKERINEIEKQIKPQQIEFEISIDAEYKGTLEKSKSVMPINADVKGIIEEVNYESFKQRLDNGEFLAEIMKEKMNNFKNSSLGAMSGAFSYINAGVIKEERTQKNPSNIEGVLDIKKGGEVKFEK